MATYIATWRNSDSFKKYSLKSCSCRGKQYTCNCPVLNNCLHGSEWINILAKICTINGGILYFLGDNFGKVYERKNARILTLAFSIFGVLLY